VGRVPVGGQVGDRGRVTRPTVADRASVRPLRLRRRARRAVGGRGSPRSSERGSPWGVPGCRRRTRGRWRRPPRPHPVRPRLPLRAGATLRPAAGPSPGLRPAPAFRSPDAPTPSSSSLRPAARAGAPPEGGAVHIAAADSLSPAAVWRFKQLGGPTGTARTGAAPRAGDPGRRTGARGEPSRQPGYASPMSAGSPRCTSRTASATSSRCCSDITVDSATRPFVPMSTPRR
jgi:hypothetical protein